MPPKANFTKDDILNAALDIVIESGLESISVRQIAKKLRSSTAPIYTCFSNVSELKDAVMEKTLELLLEYARKDYTLGRFLNIGTGLLIFSRDYSQLYKELFLKNNNYGYLLERFIDESFKVIKNEPVAIYYSDDELKRGFDKIVSFTYGLAALVCVDMLEDTSDEFFVNTLVEFGNDIFVSGLIRNGRYEEAAAKLSDSKELKFYDSNCFKLRIRKPEPLYR